MADQAKQVLGAEDLIGYLLKEPKILEAVRSSLKPQAREYSNIKISGDVNRIYFGKYSWGGFTGFWNNLVKCCDHVTFADFCIKTWDALVEMTAGTDAHTAVIEGLSREVLIQGIHQKDSAILHRFFDVCRHLTNDGYWRDKGPKSNDAPHHHSNSCPFAGGVEIEVEPHNQQYHTGQWTVRDAVGDIFEVINVKWKGGRH
jgi:hypothetical protein